ncbi:DUF397 domain-containing protein [Streptomyces scopuliridis]
MEWAPAHVADSGIVPVRDSKVPNGPILMLSPASWTDFVALAASHR